MPKISVIVPVYNAEKYLPKCLDGLINQTFKDIEIICVNDGSTDRSLSILKEYAKKDSRIVIVDKKNSGPGACRNIGIEKATGEFIQFVDSDDWIEPETCEVCYQKAKEHNVDMVSFNSTVYGPKIFPYYYYDIKKEKKIIWKDISTNLFNYHFHSWHFLYKKDFLLQNKISFPNLIWGEDVPFVMRAILKAKSIYMIPNCLYAYVQQSQSITHTSTSPFDIFEVIKLCNKLINKNEFCILKEGFHKWEIQKLILAYTKLKTSEERKKFKKMAYENKCAKEYSEMMKRIKNPNQSAFYFKLFGILPILTIKKKNQKTRYRFFGLPILTIKQKNNTTKYICCKICLAKTIRK